MPLFEKPHMNHEKHLCSKVESGSMLSDYKELVRNPKFVCTQCGRAAAKAENLCQPSPV